ncbi:damage-inducible protein DinB [Rhodocytophaga rosea]|uniref:Damage-inducible protein DinB n=1 Tax=Rhodocytophaga rosea TaxID=2704465 RepID=A0A6C0GF88_9BACT|nr:DinB family protein [Rhodocytophaga rosea]QHT66655.1 damage-inducible protein DinB [Rhodocytophaga rosea]
MKTHLLLKTLALLFSFVAFNGYPVLLLAHPNPISKTQMVADWKRAKEFTKEYLDAMPEDGVNYKPNPEVRSFAEQMIHLAGANFAFASAASGKANPYAGKKLETMEEYKTKAALSKLVLESYDFVVSALEGTADASMGDKIKLFNMDTTKELAFHKAFEHQTHHRGQATLYLRMKGVKPPQEKLF